MKKINLMIVAVLTIVPAACVNAQNVNSDQRVIEAKQAADAAADKHDKQVRQSKAVIGSSQDKISAQKNQLELYQQDVKETKLLVKNKAEVIKNKKAAYSAQKKLMKTDGGLNVQEKQELRLLQEEYKALEQELSQDKRTLKEQQQAVNAVKKQISSEKANIRAEKKKMSETKSDLDRKSVV